MERQVSLSDFLTEKQIDHCIRLYNADTQGCVYAIEDKVIKPNIETINRKLGQENDSRYLAYAVQYVLGLSQVTN